MNSPEIIAYWKEQKAMLDKLPFRSGDVIKCAKPGNILTIIYGGDDLWYYVGINSLTRVVGVLSAVSPVTTEKLLPWNSAPSNRSFQPRILGNITDYIKQLANQ